MRRAARRDANDATLAGLADRLGVWVVSTTQPVDYLCFHRGNWHLVEIKDPAKEGWESEYTESQKHFRKQADLRGAPVLTWRTEADVLKFVEGL